MNNVISVLNGGLGNQLFQWAHGLAIAKATSRRLILDIALNEQDHKRSFNIIDYQTDFKCIKTPYAEMSRLGLFWRGLQYGGIELKEEKEFTFNVFDIHQYDQRDLILKGYWQCPKYFDNYRKEILNQLVLKTTSATYNKYLPLVQQSNSIAIHVRRGDYVQDQKTNAFHGVCSMEYYVNAMQKLAQLGIQDKPLFIFSDDIEWCENQFTDWGKVTFVDGLNDRESLQLMSKCKHNIIANSSFSWWAAWLNNFAEKQIIAPQKWLNQSIEPFDLIPNTWHKI